MYQTLFPTAMLRKQQWNAGRLIFALGLAQSWPEDSPSWEPSRTHRSHLMVAVAYVHTEPAKQRRQPLTTLPGFYRHSTNNYLARFAATTELCMGSSSCLRPAWTLHLHLKQHRRAIEELAENKQSIIFASPLLQSWENHTSKGFLGPAQQNLTIKITVPPAESC